MKLCVGRCVLCVCVHFDFHFSVVGMLNNEIYRSSMDHEYKDSIFWQRFAATAIVNGVVCASQTFPHYRFEL